MSIRRSLFALLAALLVFAPLVASAHKESDAYVTLRTDKTDQPELA